MYESIIVGLGGMGSAAAAHLAQRGQRVIGFEQFSPVNELGSSHGKSRIIRQAYFEDPAYVPLLLRAYELWYELEQRTGQRLYLRTGGLMVGPEGSALVAGSQRSAREHNLAYEVLDAGEIRRRFPATRPQPQDVGVFELPAGMLFPERCVQAHLDWASQAGADLRFNTAVAEWGTTPAGTAFALTASGERFEASTLVLCAGAWLEKDSAAIGLPVRIERNVMHWFEPQSQASYADLQALPVYIIDRADDPPLYGFPYVPGEGLKAAFHHSGQYTSADTLERTVDNVEIDALKVALQAWLPHGVGAHLSSVACMYAMTPDEHFIVGRHPRSASVIIAGGFSGHGFKFCSVMGEILADLVMRGQTRHSIELFSPVRFAAKK